MPLRVVSRTPSHRTLAKIPDALRLGAVVLAELRQSGRLQQVADELPLSRRDGHGSRGLFALGTTFLLAGRASGIRPFLSATPPSIQRAMAGIAGLQALPSSAAVSRTLSGLAHEQSRRSIDGLLAADERVAAVLRSPQVQHHDAYGRGWHVLDVDPTVEPFRRRTLPEDDSRPPPERRAVGAPGYTGHKRGEIRVRHLPALHAGSGLWLGYRMTASSESLLPLLDEVVRRARRTLVEANAGERIVVRADGEFGSAGALATCQDAGVDFIARLARYSLLDREEVVAVLSAARWSPVRSSGGGPRREAAELGTFELHPSEGAAGPGRSVTARVVVMRFPCAGPATHGVVRDGYQYELIVSSLSAAAWPAADLVTLFFGRATIENRFAQEDREFGIDRTFSFHPPGQEWMSGVALFLWNFLICLGVSTAPLPEENPSQEQRAPEVGLPCKGEEGLAPWTKKVEHADADAAPAPAIAESASPTEIAEPLVLLPGGEQPDLGDGRTPSSEEIHRELWSMSRVAFADIDRSPGWTLQESAREVRCPQGKRLFLFAADPYREPSGRGQNRLMMRTEQGACDGCPVRATCTSSTRANSYKQLSRAVSAAVASRAHELLEAARRQDKPEPARTRKSPSGSATPVPTAPSKPLFTPPDCSLVAGMFVPSSPLFLPAAARERVRRLVQHLSLEVALGPRRRWRSRSSHPLLAADEYARRHTRHTFTTRATRWQADPVVSIVATKPTARRILDRLFANKQYDEPA